MKKVMKEKNLTMTKTMMTIIERNVLVVSHLRESKQTRRRRLLQMLLVKFKVVDKARTEIRVKNNGRRVDEEIYAIVETAIVSRVVLCSIIEMHIFNLVHAVC